MGNNAHKIVPVIFRANQTVFREGDESDGVMYFIFAGEVEIRKEGFGVLRTLGPGHFFGEMALVRAIPRTATAVVTSREAKLGKIDRNTFVWLAKSNPRFLKNLIGVVAKRAARALKRLRDAQTQPI
ncbi:MAG: cyclic nucleotide-binding domain-containing protein [Turneriella sp.]|nr:cyclic nucleotide-binding domain-containing protein [Turneriella sp.]